MSVNDESWEKFIYRLNLSWVLRNFLKNMHDAGALAWAAERAESDAWIAAKKSFDKDIKDAYNEGYEAGNSDAVKRDVFVGEKFDQFNW